MTQIEEIEEEEYQGSSNRFLLLTAVPAWLVSMIVHIIIVLALYVVVFDVSGKDKQVLTIEESSDAEEIEDLVIEEFEPVDMVKLDHDLPPETPEDAVIDEEVVMSDFEELTSATMQMDLIDFAADTAPFSDMLTELAGATGNATSGRGQATRTQMVLEGGGNGGSEAAVVNGIKWIAEHQLSDGSWSFDHRLGAKKPGSMNAGTIKGGAPHAATSMALLPFLGAGHTHKEGKYKKQVKAGLEALVRMIKLRGQTGSLEEPDGRMYSHGLGAITLCEAYAMTQDKDLRDPAQSVINHIVYAQDPVGGGWRYTPRQAGDTSVVGWQVMALKSGHMGYLEVPPNTVQGSIKFLDSIASNGGANYGYATPGRGKATTAVGLLCRMYLGWKKENPGLQKGVEFLSKTGPSKTEMYYNYYATQVMRHNGGPEWEKWNKVMRDQLTNDQVKPGKPEAGSWFYNTNHSKRGGRLYETSLSVLTLEVYYRHLPIYKKDAAEEDFAL
ncbi:MAG: hypothetical protein COA78_13185 [Blastopirellula sp.]|nr:MAG: hypothetical protein COA78_13185 [Blastopirellula sp.]